MRIFDIKLLKIKGFDISGREKESYSVFFWLLVSQKSQIRAYRKQSKFPAYDLNHNILCTAGVQVFLGILSSYSQKTLREILVPLLNDRSTAPFL
ncbi:hypothetical protein C9415_09890 [Kluyvera sp. Nf5]|nr:hypothetical protein C9415_09890 [Kluyvera sp. Nf5]